jgi:hypothetical protein
MAGAFRTTGRPRDIVGDERDRRVRIAVSPRGSFPQLWKRLWKKLNKLDGNQPRSPFFGPVRRAKGPGGRQTGCFSVTADENAL